MDTFYEALLIAGGAFFGSWLFLVALHYIEVDNKANKENTDES